MFQVGIGFTAISTVKTVLLIPPIISTGYVVYLFKNYVSALCICHKRHLKAKKKHNNETNVTVDFLKLLTL